jgi:hypothetical protein
LLTPREGNEIVSAQWINRVRPILGELFKWYLFIGPLGFFLFVLLNLEIKIVSIFCAILLFLIAAPLFIAVMLVGLIAIITFLNKIYNLLYVGFHFLSYKIKRLIKQAE